MSHEPRFLTIDEVLLIHQNQILLYGGSLGLREKSVLESALEAPRWAFYYQTQDLCKLAGVYLFHLVQGHAFVDGNKRIGTAAALVFLDLNGIWLDVPDGEFIDLVLGVAQGQVDKSAVGDFLTRYRD